MLKLAMYKCHRCSTIFCGGRRDCEAEMGAQIEINPEDILCVYCNGLKQGDKSKPCETHGAEYMDHKCQFCCTPARWFCFGSVRYCEPCHNIATTVIPKKCPGPELCPYGDHTPNGQPYCHGCKLCNILQLEKEKEEEEKKNQVATESTAHNSDASSDEAQPPKGQVEEVKVEEGRVENPEILGILAREFLLEEAI